MLDHALENLHGKTDRKDGKFETGICCSFTLTLFPFSDSVRLSFSPSLQASFPMRLKAHCGGTFLFGPELLYYFRILKV